MAKQSLGEHLGKLCPPCLLWSHHFDHATGRLIGERQLVGWLVDQGARLLTVESEDAVEKPLAKDRHLDQPLDLAILGADPIEHLDVDLLPLAKEALYLGRQSLQVPRLPADLEAGGRNKAVPGSAASGILEEGGLLGPLETLWVVQEQP